VPTKPVLALRPEGLYCEAGDFYVDPWRPVERAVVTHGHSDHASWGHAHYLCSKSCEPILRVRLGEEIDVQPLEFNQPITIKNATVSLHPAGHILGSAQVRIEVEGEVWVASGDYKTEADPTAEPFEPVPCHTFITETTFGLPIYQWKAQALTFDEINAWWAKNQAEGKASLLMGYALGKAQRILAGVDASQGPILVHGALTALTEVYREAGIALPETRNAMEFGRGYDFTQALILAPPSVQGTPWLRRFGDISAAFASGWMSIRGARRRRAVDRGFVLSDHVDWPSLMAAIKATGAERVWTTHGYAAQVARHLTEQGLDARPIETRFIGETADPQEDAEADAVELEVADA
jgi:putative mRNA 3-end processing factor